MCQFVGILFGSISLFIKRDEFCCKLIRVVVLLVFVRVFSVAIYILRVGYTFHGTEAVMNMPFVNVIYAQNVNLYDACRVFILCCVVDATLNRLVLCIAVVLLFQEQYTQLH